LYRRPVDRLLEIVPFTKKYSPAEFWALRDVNLGVERGEVWESSDRTGAARGTLLQVVSGILEPTRGRVINTRGNRGAARIGARVSILIHGRENVFLNGEIWAFRDVKWSAFSQIERFAEIGTYIERPVKEYSSGMYVRLAFATAIHVDPRF